MKNFVKRTIEKVQQKTLAFIADNSGSDTVEKLGMIALAAVVVTIVLLAFKSGGAGATAVNTWITTVLGKVTTAIG